MSNQIYERDGDDYEVPAPVSVISVDAEVVQSTGASTTKVMSQAAVTNKLSELSDSLEDYVDTAIGGALNGSY